MALVLETIFYRSLFTTALFLAILVCALLDVLCWLLYLGISKNEDFRNATQELRSVRSLFLIIGVYRALPMLVLGLLLIPNTHGFWVLSLMFASGCLLFAGGVRQRSDVILRAGYLRAIRLAPAQARLPHGASSTGNRNGTRKAPAPALPVRGKVQNDHPKRV